LSVTVPLDKYAITWFDPIMRSEIDKVNITNPRNLKIPVNFDELALKIVKLK
jgi:hypothetical protein